jgi:2-oxoisovalerate dehydrogenase E2 component (dihydrolipoyl transacylase)
MAEKEFKLPDVGEGLTEADIVAWHVKPGDQVEDGQVIVEIETAKAVVELPCPWDGTVTRLLAEEGQTVEVGVPIIAVEVAGQATTDRAERAEVSAPATAESTPDDEAPAEESGAHSVLVGYGVKTSSTTRRARRTAAGRPETAEVPTAPETPVEPPEVPAEPGVPAVRALAKPPVRKLAKDLGISLAALAGSGPDGSITRDDVQRAATADTQARSAQSGNGSRTATSPTVPGGEERIPVRGVRKHMAAAMVSSAFTAPHVTEFLQVDVTETMAAVRRLRELPEFAELRVSPLLFVARALLTAVARHPLVNSSWDAAAEEIVVKHYVNLGIAVAAERGLIVPNIKHADALTLPDLARGLQTLTETARAGKATPADLSGGTITITNVGVFGVDAGTPILTPGETVILAFGQVKEAPWVVGGQLAVRQVCTLSLSFDHRIVDGELGSAVLRDVGSMLTDPVRILAWS